MAAGSYFLVRKARPGRPGEWRGEWHLYLRFPGRAEEMLNSGYDICPKCMAIPDNKTLKAERGDCGCRVKPSRAAKLRLEGYNDERMLGALDSQRMRRSVATIGEVLAAYQVPGVRILKNKANEAQNVHSLRRVVAWALGLWTVHTGGVRGVKIGAQIADVERIDKLPLTVLNRALVEGYFRARLGGELDWNEPGEDNASINSTLGHARDVFSKNSRYHKLGALKLPDLKEFMESPMLPEEGAAPDPLSAGQWEAMLAGWRGETDAEIRLVNLFLRQTGLRSSYVMAATGEWLQERQDGRWVLEVKNRPASAISPAWRKKKGTRDQSIPLTEELAALLVPRRKGYLVLPEGSVNERRTLVDRKHNAWLKGHIGGAGERGQGNHRLRDTVGSVLWSLDCPAAAMEALGHASVDTTAKHYARKIEVGAAMRQELRAWLENSRQ